MDFDFDMEFNQLESILSQLPDKVEKKVANAAVSAGARVIKKEAAKRAPYNESRGNWGIHLRDAIVVKRDKLRVAHYTVGTQYRGEKAAPHAHLLEFGTVKMSPQPFLRPAFDTKGDQAKEKMFKSLATGIHREAAKLAGRSTKRKKR